MDSFLRLTSDIAGSQLIHFSQANSIKGESYTLLGEFSRLEKLFAPSETSPRISDEQVSRLPISLPKDLLADKWRPRQYTQLLSDEVCNVKIMRYFESFVHGKQNDSVSFDPYVLLLNGNPGFGKSSLSQVICRHWNFIPVEINASRERNETQFLQTVKNVLHSHSASTKFGDVNKNCLIVEELDGMSTTGIASLLHTIISEKRCCPVICITNELYIPLLRNFRQHKLVSCLTIPPIDEKRMLQRLMRIAQAENIYPGVVPEKLRFIIKNIVSQACGDIRVALNLLQLGYLPGESTQERRSRTELDGMSPFTLWSFILSRKRQTIQSQEILRTPVMEILRQLKRCTNSQLLADGVFENMYQFYGIGALQRTTNNLLLRGADLWSTIDTLSRYFGAAAETLLRIFILQTYLSIQRDGAYVSTSDLKWPRVNRDKLYRDSVVGQMLIAFMQKYTHQFKTFLTLTEVVTDYRPAFTSISHSIKHLLNESNGHDYSRLPATQQERIEHVAVLLQMYGIISSSSGVTSAQKKAERRCLISGNFEPPFFDALSEIANYCCIRDKELYRKLTDTHTSKKEVLHDSKTRQQMSLRALMRDAPKLPVSKEAAEAEKRRVDPFSKFRVPKRGDPDVDNRAKPVLRATASSEAKRHCATSNIKVRFRPYKFSTSAVIRQALLSDFMM